MKAYSLHDREVGYCQGSGFIVGLLLMQVKSINNIFTTNYKIEKYIKARNLSINSFFVNMYFYQFFILREKRENIRYLNTLLL